MRIGGIDCGKQGAFVIIDSTKGVSEAELINDTPIILITPGKTKKGKLKKGKNKTIYDIPAMNELIRANHIDYLYIENAQAMPGQGVTSMFSIGKGFGIWLGLIVANGIPYETVSPQKWQKIYGIKGKKFGIDQAYKVAIKLFDNVNDFFSTKRGRILDGRADAVLIAEYGAREQNKMRMS